MCTWCSSSKPISLGEVHRIRYTMGSLALSQDNKLDSIRSTCQQNFDVRKAQKFGQNPILSAHRNEKKKKILDVYFLVGNLLIIQVADRATAAAAVVVTKCLHFVFFLLFNVDGCTSKYLLYKKIFTWNDLKEVKRRTWSMRKKSVPEYLLIFCIKN